MAIFVINMAEDVERRSHMLEALRRVGLEATFIPATIGRDLSASDRLAYDRARTLRTYGSDMLDAEIGCYLSHYRLYQRILAEKIPVALILEDDLHIEQTLPEILEVLLENLDPDWLIVRLESLRGRVVTPRKAAFLGTCVQTLTDTAALYRLRTHVLGAGAYLIRAEGAARMVAYGRRIFMPIDQTMDRFWENGIVPYVVRPFPVSQRADFASRIGERPANRHRALPFRIRAQLRLQRLRDSVQKRFFNWRMRHR